MRLFVLGRASFLLHNLPTPIYIICTGKKQKKKDEVVRIHPLESVSSVVVANLFAMT